MKKVTIFDDQLDYIAVKQWCLENCPSFIDVSFIDMSDISSWTGPDNGYDFFFDNEKDAMLFSLKWT